MKSTEKRISVFFYGSFIRKEVMARANFHPKQIEVARLSGFNILFCPHANIVRSDKDSIFGIVVRATHEELNNLYSMNGVGLFLPEAVLVEIMPSNYLPVVCYIPPKLDNKPADIVYVENLIKAAKEYKFPQWYLSKLKDAIPI